MLFTRQIARKRLRTALFLPPLVCLLLAIWACGFSLAPHMGYRPPPVTHLPASQLRMTVHITGQYSQYGDKPVLVMQIRFFVASTNSEVSLADKASLTCNVVDIKNNMQGISAPCPLQPPGGAYRLTYTDEHGVATTVVVPVPNGAFAILSPRDGASVPIPTNGAFAVRYSTPVSPANGDTTISNISVACSVSDAQPCGALFAVPQPGLTPTPGQGMGGATGAPMADEGVAVLALSVNRGIATPIPARTPTRGPTPATPPTPGLTPLPGATTTPTTPYATMTQNGETGTILLSGDYSAFQPAKGLLSMAVEVRVTPDSGSFAAVTASFSDTLHTTFSWTR